MNSTISSSDETQSLSLRHLLKKLHYINHVSNGWEYNYAISLIYLHETRVEF